MAAVKLSPISGFGCFNCGQLLRTPVTANGKECGCNTMSIPRVVILLYNGRVYESVTLDRSGYVESVGQDLGSWKKVFGISHE